MNAHTPALDLEGVHTNGRALQQEPPRGQENHADRPAQHRGGRKPRQTQALYLRLPLDLRAQLDVLADRYSEPLTIIMQRALRDMLVKEHLWPPPKPLPRLE